MCFLVRSFSEEEDQEVRVAVPVGEVVAGLHGGEGAADRQVGDGADGVRDDPRLHRGAQEVDARDVRGVRQQTPDRGRPPLLRGVQPRVADAGGAAPHRRRRRQGPQHPATPHGAGRRPQRPPLRQLAVRAGHRLRRPQAPNDNNLIAIHTNALFIYLFFYLAPNGRKCTACFQFAQ